MTKEFDRIDMVTSAVAQHIFHASFPEHVKLLACLRFAPYVSFIQDEHTRNIPTIITYVYELAEAKRDMRQALEGDVVKHPVYKAAIKAMEKVGQVDQKNFLEVVSSKLFELLLAHHTEMVTSRVIKEAEESGDGSQSVGVAFALENEDENQQYH